jgi:3-hydroxybutyrate dehydrogenase
MTGRVALVTGPGRGIGRATALALSRAGHRVMAVSRTQDDLNLAREAPLDYVVGSLATPEGCELIVAASRDRLGPIGILVNNAPVDSGREDVIWKQDPSVWQATLAVNFDAAFHFTRLTVQDMVERRWGRIVMVSSTAGRVGGPRMSDYCASKHGLIGPMRSVEQDVARHGVTRNAVLPGCVRTPMAERTAAIEAEERGMAPNEVWSERALSYPAGRVLEPEKVARVIGFLAGEAASGINGACVTVSLGGLW